MIITAEKYIELSNLAVAAAVDPGRWQQFLDELAQVIGTRVFTQMMGYDELTRAAPLTCSSGYDPELLRLYEEHYSDKNPYASNFSKCAVGNAISARELCPPEKLRKTEFYSELLLPHGDICAGGGSMLALDRHRMFLVGGNMREKDRDRYEQDWLNLCVRLAPVLRQSLEINRAISGLTFEKWAAEQHMLGTGTAILVVDQAMTIHHACREGQKLLASGTLVGSGFYRRLQFLSEEAQSRFASLARIQSRGEENILDNWRLTDQRGQTWVCRAMGVRLGDLDETPFGAFLTESISAILLAIRPETSLATFQVRLQNAFDLSQTEAETALMLAEGLSLAEIAQSRQVSVHTVRNQVKAALAKSGCRRQSDLVRKVEQIRLHGLSL